MYFIETSAEVSVPLKKLKTGNKERGCREVKKKRKKKKIRRKRKEERERERFLAAFKTYLHLGFSHFCMPSLEVFAYSSYGSSFALTLTCTLPQLESSPSI